MVIHGKTACIFFIVLVVMLLPASPAHSLCVKKSDVNLRAGPGTNYRKTGELFKFTPLKRLKTRGDWIQVRDVNGKKNWIHRNLVTSKYRCAVVKVGEANIRNGPGTKYREIEYSPSIRYETFKVLTFKGSWVKVEDEFEGRGWIYRKLLWLQ